MLHAAKSDMTISIANAKKSGRKEASLISSLHLELKAEFDRMPYKEVNYNGSTLLLVAKKLIQLLDFTEYGTFIIELKSGKFTIDLLNNRWIQYFMQNHEIVSINNTKSLPCVRRRNSSLSIK